MQSCARSPDTLIPGQCIHSRARAVGCMAGLVLVCVQSAQAFYFSINVSSSQSSICSDGMRASLCWVRIGIRARIHGGTFHPAWNIFTVRRRAVLRNCSGGIGAGPPWHGDHARVPRLAAESTCSPMLRARPANHRPPRPPGSPNEGTQGFQGAACKFDGGCGPVRARGVSSAESHPKWGCVCVCIGNTHTRHEHRAIRWRCILWSTSNGRIVQSHSKPNIKKKYHSGTVGTCMHRCVCSSGQCQHAGMCTGCTPSPPFARSQMHTTAPTVRTSRCACAAHTHMDLDIRNLLRARLPGTHLVAPHRRIAEPFAHSLLAHSRSARRPTSSVVCTCARAASECVINVNSRFNIGTLGTDRVS